MLKIVLANRAVFNARSVDGRPRELARAGFPEIITMVDNAQGNYDQGNGLISTQFRRDDGKQIWCGMRMKFS